MATRAPRSWQSRASGPENNAQARAGLRNPQLAQVPSVRSHSPCARADRELARFLGRAYNTFRFVNLRCAVMLGYAVASQPAHNLMERAMRKTVLRILVGGILLSLLSGIVVSIIGLVYGWTTSAQFGDGFFWAGAIMIVFGFVSFQGYSQRATDWPPVQSDPSERAKLWAADTFRGKTLLAAFGVSGALLFGLSFLVMKLF
jgi:hypothetical protein